MIHGLSNAELIDYAKPVSELEIKLLAAAKEIFDELQEYRDAARERELQEAFLVDWESIADDLKDGIRAAISLIKTDPDAAVSKLEYLL